MLSELRASVVELHCQKKNKKRHSQHGILYTVSKGHAFYSTPVATMCTYSRLFDWLAWSILPRSIRSHVGSSSKQALSIPRDAMAGICKVVVRGATFAPKVIMSAPPENTAHGWSKSEVEAVVRKALGGDKDGQALFHIFLHDTITRPVCWICRFLDISSRLDGGTMGRPYTVNPIAVHFCQLFEVLAQKLISGRLFLSPLNPHECTVFCHFDWVWNRAVQKPIYRHLQLDDATPEEDL